MIGQIRSGNMLGVARKLISLITDRAKRYTSCTSSRFRPQLGQTKDWLLRIGLDHFNLRAEMKSQDVVGSQRPKAGK